MRKLTMALLLLEGISGSVCNGQERSSFACQKEVAGRRLGDGAIPLKAVLLQIQDAYNVNLLADAKREGLNLQSSEQLERLREVLQGVADMANADQYKTG
jgi:hypothetical protein